MADMGVVKALANLETSPLDAKLNKTEQAYAEMLDLSRAMGRIHSYYAQRWTVLLGPDLRYTPDFMVIRPDGRIEFVEIKGFEREDAIVKFKLAAELHPWADWKMVRKKGKLEGGGWEVTREY